MELAIARKSATITSFEGDSQVGGVGGDWTEGGRGGCGPQEVGGGAARGGTLCDWHTDILWLVLRPTGEQKSAVFSGVLPGWAGRCRDCWRDGLLIVCVHIQCTYICIHTCTDIYIERESPVCHGRTLHLRNFV